MGFGKSSLDLVRGVPAYRQTEADHGFEALASSELERDLTSRQETISALLLRPSLHVSG